MASFNKITIVGYLGRDPELRYLPNGDAVVNFSVATTDKRKGRDGEPVETTTWFKVSVFGRSAEACNEYLFKGSQVYVDGPLRTNEYTDRDGNQRTSLEVTAREVHFLTSRNAGGGEGGEEPRQARQSSSAGRSTSRAASSVEEDEIPF